MKMEIFAGGDGSGEEVKLKQNPFTIATHKIVGRIFGRIIMEH